MANGIKQNEILTSQKTMDEKPSSLLQKRNFSEMQQSDTSPESLIRLEQPQKHDESGLIENQPAIHQFKSLRDLVKVSGSILNTNSTKVQMN